MLRLIACLLIATLTTHAQDITRIPAGEQPEAARLFKIYRESTDAAARETAVAALVKMHYTVLQQLVPIIERDWQGSLTTWRNTVARTAGEIARKRASDAAFKSEVTKLRTSLTTMRKKEPSKEQLKNEAGPALKRLRELHTITATDLTAAQPALAPLTTTTRALTRMRAAVQAKILLKNDLKFPEQNLDSEQALMLAKAFREDKNATAVLDMNEDLAAKKAIPADEAEGIRDLNEMRLLMGLAPVLIDPKLHNAARDHSKDMAEMNFFAHESPVPGKKTPWDRAKRAGTSAGAENIFAGSESPKAANEGWFYSPGHHVNMFGSHRRGAMGRHGGHWTQMFGG